VGNPDRVCERKDSVYSLPQRGGEKKTLSQRGKRFTAKMLGEKGPEEKGVKPRSGGRSEKLPGKREGSDKLDADGPGASDLVGKKTTYGGT